jgi:2'-5' RNA ligase
MRLFIAVNLPSHVREAVWDATASLRDEGLPVRWVQTASLHLTLKFLGEVDPGREIEVMRSLDTAVRGASTIRLAIVGFGAFPNSRRARVIWVGFEPVPGLELVQNRIEEEMQRIGFPVEGRPFRPHMTIGRVKRDARPSDLRGLDSLLERLQFTSETVVHSVDLMQSELMRSGARYTRLYAAELEER